MTPDVTEDKTAEVDNLRQRLDLINAVVGNAADGLWTFDAEAHFTFINPAAERMLGWPAGELLGRLVHETVHYRRPDGTPYPPEECSLLNVLRSGQSVSDHEEVFTRRDGSLFPALCLAAPIFRVGHVDGAVVSFRDITERKRMEDALRESEERYRVIFGSVPVAVFVCDRNAVIQHYNRRAVELWGREPECGVERHCGSVKLYLPDGTLLPHAESPMVEVLRTGIPAFNVEVFIERPDGSRLPVLVNFAALKDARDEITGVVTSFIDIAERKQLDDVLRQSEAQRTALIDQSPIGMYLVDAELRFRQVNPKARPVFGDISDLIGRDFVEVIHVLWPHETADDIVARFRHTLETGEPYFVPGFAENRVDRGGREYYDWEIHRVSLPDSQYGVVCYFTDISAHVFTLVREQEARAEAENANRLKDEFLATLSHELRTPLTAIIGWSNILIAGGMKDADAARALETIYRNARAQNQLIDDLLEVSRIVTGKLRLDVQPVDLAAVIVAATDAARPAAEAKNIRLQTLLDSQASSVSGDPDRLQQVVWNLVSNAVKFTPKGGRVQIKLERVNSHIEITVADTGAGIKPEFLPYVFDRFRQSDATVTRKHGGLGLGLSIVRQLVELHGGTVRAESEGEGHGAIFIVSLPFIVTRRDTPLMERVHPSTNLGNISFKCPPQLVGLRVLIVDDESDTRDLLRAVMERCGCEVTTLGSAAEALAALQQTNPDVLISDIGMPEEDGYTLIRKVRALPTDRGGRTPAIALTAYARAEDRVRALMAGFQVHVPKPVEPMELAAVVASLTRRNG